MHVRETFRHRQRNEIDPKGPGTHICTHTHVHMWDMGLVQSRAECCVSELVIEFMEVVHVSPKLTPYHKPLIMFVFCCAMDCWCRKLLTILSQYTHAKLFRPFWLFTTMSHLLFFLDRHQKWNAHKPWKLDTVQCFDIFLPAPAHASSIFWGCPCSALELGMRVWLRNPA